MKKSLMILAMAVIPCLAAADETDLRAHVEFLSSPLLEGRLTGSEGERIASEYLGAQLRARGIQPLPGHDSFLLPFDFVSGMKDEGSSIKLTQGATAKDFPGDHVVGMSFSDNGTISAPVVFAGYGIKSPGSSETPYDSFHELDVKGKIVVMLRYFPENVKEEAFRHELSRYAGLRYKAMNAREAGAVGVIVLTGPNSPNAGKTVPVGFDTSVAGSQIIAVSADGEFADALFAGEDKTLKAIQTELDSGNPHVSGFAFTNKTVTISAAIKKDRREGHNVVGYLPATKGETDEYVLIGAHYDHLGHGAGGDSLAGEGDAGKIHPGADDNASGVAVILEVAGALAREQRPRNIALAFWSGEELGVIGSQAFIDKKLIPVEKITAYLNLDMVGYARDNKLSAQGIGSAPEWPSIVEKANMRPGFDLVMSKDPYLPTDASVFYTAKVPVLNLFTGAHENYHKPSDTAEKLNYEAMDRMVTLATNIVGSLMNDEKGPTYTAVERTKPEGESGRGVGRVYTGTIPDYAAEVEGLKLSGVMKDGPAAKAGLEKGDVIIEFGGRKVANIYDYMYALEGIKIGEKTAVVVMRGDKRVALEIIPEARK
ncbi:M20/M25/M40 family metallo-hydrolase [Candidatus Sumerlaeota bacterium]|nr:M20/M25/M40 family metallo-hydrolase [Candidatus Sumerlaeota bacterium]